MNPRRTLIQVCLLVYVRVSSRQPSRFRFVARRAGFTRTPTCSSRPCYRWNSCIHGNAVSIFLEKLHQVTDLYTFSDDLMQYLRPFAAEGKEVNETDIQAFFDARREGRNV
jgi:hypothetical protein